MNLFTTRELSEVLESLDVNNSSGEDTIENTIIRKLPQKNIKYMISYFQYFLENTRNTTGEENLY